MKIQHVILTLTCIVFLSGCRVPFAPVPATPTPESSATSTPLPRPTDTLTRTPAPSSTHFLTHTPTVSPTAGPAKPTNAIPPTATSPYPVGAGTPLPNPGFVEITNDNATKMIPIVKIIQQKVWQSAASRDGKLLFVATNNGMFLYDKQGQQLAHWPSIMLPDQPCASCLSINSDGSRFALMTHRDGKWLAQVYNVLENNESLLFEKIIDETTVQSIPNEARIAISPDGLMLGYGVADNDTLLTDFGSGQTLLTSQGGAASITFSPDGVYYIVRRGREMLFWKTNVWKNPTNLLLPTADSPYAFSADGKRLAVAQTDKILAYTLDTLALTREISIPTPKNLMRNWQLAFLDQNILAGYNERWNSDHSKATIDIAQWNLETGETLQMGTQEVDSPDALSALWGANIPLAEPRTGSLTLGQYDAFQFVDPDQLLVNSRHSACWVKLSSGESTCREDKQYRVFSSHTEAYIEVPQPNTTLLKDWNNRLLHTVGAPYPILAVNATANYVIINVKDITTDIYGIGEKSPSGSLVGTLLAYAENAVHIVIFTAQKPTGMLVTMIDKRGMQTAYQKKGDFILKPIAMDVNSRVYYIQQDVGQGQFILKTIDGTSYTVNDLARLTLPAEPQAMSISANGILALGLKDGSVAIVSPDGLKVTTFQAVSSPINGISLSADGRTLAVASTDGIRVFAVLP